MITTCPLSAALQLDALLTHLFLSQALKGWRWAIARVIDVELAPLTSDEELIRSISDQTAVLMVAWNARVRLCLCSLC